MQEKQRFSVYVDKDVHFGNKKATFTAHFEMDADEVAKFLTWCAWNTVTGIGYEEYLKKNLDAMRDLVEDLWGRDFFRFIRGRQNDLADYFEDEIRDQMDADEDFKQSCYEECADADVHNDFGSDYQSWWEEEGL